MNPNAFDTLINSLKKNNSYANKMHTMQVNIGAAGAISTSQVIQLLKHLSSDTDKLELAKMAYGYVINQDSYDEIVGEAFSSSGTKASLNGYIYRY